MAFQFILCWYLKDITGYFRTSYVSFNSFFVDTQQDHSLFKAHALYLSIHSLLILIVCGHSWWFVFVRFQFILCWYTKKSERNSGFIKTAFNSFFVDTRMIQQTKLSEERSLSIHSLLIQTVYREWSGVVDSFNSFFVDTVTRAFNPLLASPSSFNSFFVDTWLRCSLRRSSLFQLSIHSLLIRRNYK